MNKKTPIIVTALAIFLFILSASNPFALKAKVGKFVTCSMEETYEQARADYANYKKDPVTYERFKHLDGDGDGEACEDLPSIKNHE